MTQTTKIKILQDLGKEGKSYKFKCEEVDSGEIVQIKVFENKHFIDNMQVGKIGKALINENWCNLFEEYEIEDKPQPLPKTNTTQTVTQYNSSVKNGARLGMLVNNAVQIAIEEMKAQNKDTIDMNRVSGLIQALDVITQKYEK